MWFLCMSNNQNKKKLKATMAGLRYKDKLCTQVWKSKTCSKAMSEARKKYVNSKDLY